MEQNTQTQTQTKAINTLLKVGDIMEYQWGYDQTNVTFYEVVSLRGKTQVQVRKLKSSKSYSESMLLCGTTIPLKEYASEKVLTKKVRLFRDKPIIDLEYGFGEIWNGKPSAFTEYS